MNNECQRPFDWLKPKWSVIFSVISLLSLRCRISDLENRLDAASYSPALPGERTEFTALAALWWRGGAGGEAWSSTCHFKVFDQSEDGSVEPRLAIGAQRLTEVKRVSSPAHGFPRLKCKPVSRQPGNTSRSVPLAHYRSRGARKDFLDIISDTRDPGLGGLPAREVQSGHHLHHLRTQHDGWVRVESWVFADARGGRLFAEKGKTASCADMLWVEVLAAVV